MEKFNHVFTKQGDKGYTKLYNGTKVDKDNIFIEANGHLDELTSYIGLVKSKLEDKKLVQQMEAIQNQLIVVMGVVAGLDNKIDIQSELDKIESWIIEYEKKYPKQTSFVLPGKCELSAHIDIARTICRRAERNLVKCLRESNIDDSLPKYINRLSDYFHVVARYIEFVQVIDEKVKEIIWSADCKVINNKLNDINLEQAKKIMDGVQQKASEMGINVVIAISNKDGNPIAVHVMDNAYIASYDIAVNKAFTSVSLKMTTEKLSELAKPDGSLYGIQFTNNGRIVIFGGGTPLIYEDSIIGGLGVSGGSAEEDTLLANYGADLIRKEWNR
ncbi:MAG: cob(I)yrinic acid a,c-diamide adenosyltransferase [Vallitalea sp.]|jgi:ATP:cob(I)alamin adenosyltransferase|nr:cob(I)yrinic acid a,c-diamide adenosyltransferase [Vallitalea sp.]